MSENSFRAVTALIVGGGPVAQIIGKHLKMSGIDDIGLMLKPKYAPIADQGFELHQLITMKKKRLRQRYDDFKIVPSVETLQRVHYDQVYICVSGPELRSGWLEQAWPHLRHSLWITFTSGIDDYEYLARTIPERYIVMGQIGFLAYDAPLPGENIDPRGVAFWFPPGQMTYFKGHDEVTTALIVRTFERAGMPCGTRSSFDADRIYASAAVTCFAAALEIHNWDLKSLLADTVGMARLCVTQGEIGTAIYARYQTDSTLNRRLRKPFWWKLALKYLDGVIPLPLAQYMKAHFSKHRRQMEQQFGDFVKIVRASGSEATGTQSLARDWARNRPELAERSIDHLMPMGMIANTSTRSVFSETGQLGGEARGKAAADAKGMPLGSAAVPVMNAQQPFGSGSQQPTHGFPVQPAPPGQNPSQATSPAMPQQPQPQQGYPPQQQQGYPPQQQQGYPPPQGYPPQQQQGYPPQQQQGYPPQQQQGYPPQQQQGYPPQQQQGYPPQQQPAPHEPYVQDHTEPPFQRDDD